MRHAVRLTTASVVATYLATGTLAQTDGAPDPSSYDVAGVRLGMTPDEATTALKSFDPDYKITRGFLTRQAVSFAQQGDAVESISPAEKPLAYLYDLTAKKGEPKTVCPPGSLSSYGCQAVYEGDEDAIHIWFAPLPGQEKVIAIQRTDEFHKKPPPAIPTMKSTVLAKYGQASVTYVQNIGFDHTIGWLFDARMRPVSDAAAKSKRLEEPGGLPRMVKPGDGICLNVVFVSNNQNADIAQRFFITLYDGTALFNSIAQSKTTAAALKARANAEQLDKSIKGSAQTKF